jgi:hypothetical protein
MRFHSDRTLADGAGGFSTRSQGCSPRVAAAVLLSQGSHPKAEAPVLPSLGSSPRVANVLLPAIVHGKSYLPGICNDFCPGLACDKESFLQASQARKTRFIRFNDPLVPTCSIPERSKQGPKRTGLVSRVFGCPRAVMSNAEGPALWATQRRCLDRQPTGPICKV